jgi:hypothetical protein
MYLWDLEALSSKILASGIEAPVTSSEKTMQIQQWLYYIRACFVDLFCCVCTACSQLVGKLSTAC